MLVSKIWLVCFYSWLIHLVTESQTTKINKLWVKMEAFVDPNNMNYKWNVRQ